MARAMAAPLPRLPALRLLRLLRLLRVDMGLASGSGPDCVLRAALLEPPRGGSAPEAVVAAPLLLWCVTPRPPLLAVGMVGAEMARSLNSFCDSMRGIRGRLVERLTQRRPGERSERMPPCAWPPPPPLAPPVLREPVERVSASLSALAGLVGQLPSLSESPSACQRCPSLWLRASAERSISLGGDRTPPPPPLLLPLLPALGGRGGKAPSIGLGWWRWWPSNSSSSSPRTGDSRGTWASSILPYPLLYP